MTVSFSRFDRIDSHSDSMTVLRDGISVGEIVKTHGTPPEALSMVDTRGRVEHYDVDLWVNEDGDSVNRLFRVCDYPTARAALKAAKAWAIKTSESITKNEE
jgi:hypothetical protein